MIRTCETCRAEYDDAMFLTYCPHERFISEFDAAQKDMAVELLGKDLRFAHEWRDGPVYRVRSIGPTGMVTLDSPDMAGEFAPYLFVLTTSTAPPQRMPRSAPS